MEFNPIEDRIIIEISQEDVSTTSGGVIMPDLTKESNLFGKVVAIGPGMKSQVSGTYTPGQCKVGDRVLYQKNMSKLIEVDDVEYHIIKECEILTIIKEDK